MSKDKVVRKLAEKCLKELDRSTWCGYYRHLQICDSELSRIYICCSPLNAHFKDSYIIHWESDIDFDGTYKKTEMVSTEEALKIIRSLAKIVHICFYTNECNIERPVYDL
jgi:hypothetical protein